VRFQRVLLGGQFHMDRGKLVAGAVVVHDEVVDALHDGRGENDLLDPLDKFRRGRLQAAVKRLDSSYFAVVQIDRDYTK